MSKATMRTTGVPGLDIPLEGGFPHGSIVIVAGSPLAGLDQMARQFWSIEGEQGPYLMIDGDVEEGMTDASALSPDAIISLLGGKRVVVDSLSTLIIRFGIDAGCTFLTSVKKHLHETGANALLTFYTEIHQPIEEIRVQRAADIYIELKEVVFMNELERQLAVHKVRGIAVPKRLIPFNLTEKGIELSTTSRVV
ncbi:MAG: hypothetical protein NT074_05430 [Methanomicrobiales archaeon]|nr:hypothetical protein [Methanomicrobiales archaeon]